MLKCQCIQFQRLFQVVYEGINISKALSKRVGRSVHSILMSNSNIPDYHGFNLACVALVYYNEFILQNLEYIHVVVLTSFLSTDLLSFFSLL